MGSSFVTAAFTKQRAAISAGGMCTASCVIHERARSWQRHPWKHQDNGMVPSALLLLHPVTCGVNQASCWYCVHAEWWRRGMRAAPVLCDPHPLPGSRGGTEHLQSAKKELVLWCLLMDLDVASLALLGPSCSAHTDAQAGGAGLSICKKPWAQPASASQQGKTAPTLSSPGAVATTQTCTPVCISKTGSCCWPP